MRRRLGTMLALVSVLGLAWMLGGPAGAIGDETFESASGTFSDAARYDSLAIECLQYGTGDPPTFSPPPPTGGPFPWGPLTGIADPTIQEATPGVLNQVRFGQVPEGVALQDGQCSTDPAAETGLGSSGFGFRGAESLVPVNDWFEMGRLFHYNRTIERGARSPVEDGDFVADTPATLLNTTFTMLDPVTGTSVDFTTEYGIQLLESSDQAGIDPDDPPACTDTIPGTDDLVPGEVANIGGIDVLLCQDVVRIEQRIPFGYATFGQTQVTIQVAGFAQVDDQGCDAGAPVEGNQVLTSEQDINPLCLLGRIRPGQLVIDKLVDDAPDATFDFEWVEFDQASSPAAPTDNTGTVNVTTADGIGTSDPVEVEPGIYTLAELVPPGYQRGDEMDCTADGPGGDGQATTTVDGQDFLDIDSGETVTCEIVNTAEPTPSPTPTPSPDPTSVPTDTPVATETASPTPAPTPTQTNSPAPTRSPIAAPTPGPELPATGTDGRLSGLAVAALVLLAVGGSVLRVVPRQGAPSRD